MLIPTTRYFELAVHRPSRHLQRTHVWPNDSNSLPRHTFVRPALLTQPLPALAGPFRRLQLQPEHFQWIWKMNNLHSIFEALEPIVHANQIAFAIGWVLLYVALGIVRCPGQSVLNIFAGAFAAQGRGCGRSTVPTALPTKDPCRYL